MDNSSTRTVLGSSAHPDNETAPIAFRVMNQGKSTLNLTSRLYDYPPAYRDPRISLPIDHTVVNGLFEQVIPEMPNQPLLALLLAHA